MVIFFIFGLLLLIIAVRNFFGEDNPDAPPPKIMTILDKMGPFKLFGVGVVLNTSHLRDKEEREDKKAPIWHTTRKEKKKELSMYR